MRLPLILALCLKIDFWALFIFLPSSLLLIRALFRQVFMSARDPMSGMLDFATKQQEQGHAPRNLTHACRILDSLCHQSRQELRIQHSLLRIIGRISKEPREHAVCDSIKRLDDNAILVGIGKLHIEEQFPDSMHQLTLAVSVHIIR